VVFGRGADAAIRIDDDGVSRLHARIERSASGEASIADLDSRNGTWVNGQRVRWKLLTYGDVIEIGKSTALRFIYQNDMEAQLQQSQRLEAVGQLAGGIAHEFNNLLGVITANLSWLRGELDSGSLAPVEETLAAIDDCLVEARRGADLTGGLLEFSRKRQPQFVTVKLDALLHDTARLLRRTIDRAIEVRTEVAALSPILGDGSQLRQVLLNLVLNAKDAMPDGGLLTIAARDVVIDASHPLAGQLPLGRHVELSVADTGTGMDESTQRRVFEPFFTTKPVGKGTGLGLAVVYGIVQSHGGTISLHSRPGEGTRFSLYLPALAQVDETRPLSDPDTQRSPVPAGTQIMVVDDELGVRRAVQRLLSRLGYRSIAACSGLEAVELFRANRKSIGMVIVDLSMPEIDGEETCQRLRQIDPDVRVVVSSGYLEDDRLEALRRAGVDVCLRKPYEARELSRVIRAVLVAPDVPG
jgi:signal transduction histidine kinase/CheY-like chemotaxis protein